MSFLDNPYLWYKASTSLHGFEYYLQILVCVDYFLIMEKFPRRYMEIVKYSFTVNRYSIE